MVAVDVAAVELVLVVQEETALDRLWAAKAEESLGVAVRHLIGPIAAIAVRIEGQTFRTIEHITSTVHAIHELAAFLPVADLEVAILMGTLLGRIRRL